MLDLEKVKVIGKEEFQPEEVPFKEESQVQETPQEVVSETSETPVVESAPVNDFPSDKFGGKFNSWEEVNEVLNKPAPETPKYDEFLQKVIDKYQADGNLEDFFKAYSVDYDKLSDEEIIKRDFFAKNSDLSQKAVNKLWEKELAKYKLDPDENDEDEIEIATAMMKREATKLRESGKEYQKQYIQPQKTAQKASVEDLVKTVHAMPEAQGIKARKSISFNIGDSVINYGIEDVDDALTLMADEEKFGALFLENGRPNVEKWVRMVEFAKNEDRIIKTAYDQGKAAGMKELEKEIKNPSLPSTPRPEKGFSSGDFKDRFFEALAGKTA